MQWVFLFGVVLGFGVAAAYGVARAVYEALMEEHRPRGLFGDVSDPVPTDRFGLPLFQTGQAIVNQEIARRVAVEAAMSEAEQKLKVEAAFNDAEEIRRVYGDVDKPEVEE